MIVVPLAVTCAVIVAGVYAALAARWNRAAAYCVVACVPLALAGYAWLERERLSFFIIIPLLLSVASSLVTVLLGVSLLVRSRAAGLRRGERVVVATAACLSALPLFVSIRRDVESKPTLTAFYRSMDIDPQTLVVTLSGAESMDEVQDA